MNEFINKLIKFSIGPIVGAIIGFITIPLVTRFVPPVEYGKVSMFVLAQNLLPMLVLLGLDQAYVRSYHEEKDKHKLILNAMCIPIVLSVLIVMLLPMNASKISLLLFGNPDFILPVYFLVITIPLSILERFMLLNVRMQEKGLQYSLFNIFLKLIIFVTTLIYVMYIRRDFLAVVYSSIIGSIIGDTCLFIVYRKTIKISFNLIDKALIKELCKFGMPLAPAALVGVLLNSIDRMGLRSWSSFEQIGMYFAANKMVKLLAIVQTSFTSFWAPIAYRWHKEGKETQYFTLVGEWLAFGMSLIFVSILLFKDFIVFILSDNYKGVQYIIPFLLFYPIMYTMSETTTLGIAFSKKTYFNLVISIVSLMVNLILNMFFIPNYGARGAAFSTGISYIVFFWMRTIISRSIWYRFPVRKFTIYTILLFAISLFNVFIQNTSIYAINLIGIITILVINIDLFKKGINIKGYFMRAS